MLREKNTMLSESDELGSKLCNTHHSVVTWVFEGHEAY